jgi:acetyl-CoA carboxylase carboxyl transferase subunit alpha
MMKFGLVDGIVPESLGGSHWDHMRAAAILKNYLIPVIQELKLISPEDRVSQRIEKFSKMGFWEDAQV